MDSLTGSSGSSSGRRNRIDVRAVLLTTPEGLPALAFALCYSGPSQRADSAVGPLRAFGPPATDLVRPMSYPAMQSLLDAAAPSGMHDYWPCGSFTPG